MSAENTASGLDNSYTYDSDGLRLTKTVGDVQHKYVWQGSRLVSENWAGQELEFFYDESGSPYAFSYKASATATPVMYYYVTNLQGDVVNILDAGGNIKASYTYNAWGEILSATGDMADINPLRYRGYYFDSDTGLYYLKARYYDPQLCRFINADGYASTGQGVTGTNMFAYCGNNPVSRVDDGGYVWDTVFDLVTLGASVVDVIANPYNVWAWAGLAGDVIDVVIPFVSGVGEVTKAIGATKRVASAADDAVDAASSFITLKRNVGTYNDLRRMYRNSGAEVHHIIEKRFFRQFTEIGSTGRMMGVALSPAEHAYFTKLWRQTLPYGASYSREAIIQAAYQVYSHNPKLLQIALSQINRMT